MRTGRVPLAALLLVLASTVLQVSCTNDLYWEGEEYGSNEFLEVKPEDSAASDSHKRLKRDWGSWGIPNFFSTNDKEPEAETVTTVVPDDTGSYDKDDTDLDVGSGIPDKTESEPKEKTLRVTFSVMEPYRTAYSNRDSPEFLNLSRSLANAVDQLFESLPGTQRSSLVRIQSLVNDDFLCKVTLDIVTTRNEDTDTIKEILRNHIKNNGRLGNTSVRDGDFSAQLIDPGATFECDFNEFSCDEDYCLPNSMKCDGREDCRDGTDESDCPVPEPTEPATTDTTTVDINNVDENNAPTPDYRNVDQTNDNSNYNQSLENPYEPTNNANPYDPNVYRDITVPYDQNSRPDNRDPYGQNSRPDDRNPYGQSSNPDNRDPYNPSSNPDNRDLYGQNSNPDNRDPYGQNSSPDNWDPYGQNTRPDDQDPSQGGNPEARPNPDADTSDSRGDLGGADSYSTDTPDEPDTVTETTDAIDTTPTPQGYECPPNYTRCDETRCIEQTRRCDGRNDCYDGTDEANCPSRPEPLDVVQWAKANSKRLLDTFYGTWFQPTISPGW